MSATFGIFLICSCGTVYACVGACSLSSWKAFLEVRSVRGDELDRRAAAIRDEWIRKAGRRPKPRKESKRGLSWRGNSSKKLKIQAATNHERVSPDGTPRRGEGKSDGHAPPAAPAAAAPAARYLSHEASPAVKHDTVEGVGVNQASPRLAVTYVATR